MSGIPCVGCGHPDAAVRSNAFTGRAYTDCPACRSALAIPRRPPTLADRLDLFACQRAMRGETLSRVGRGDGLRHGSAVTYRRHGCRCDECRAAKSIEMAEYQFRRANGLVRRTA